MSANYDEGTIKTLDWQEHIRRRPGMYIGKLGDGSSADDGIYVLLKEVMDNSIDEFMMGHGKKITVNVDQETVTIRDYGRGIPLGKLEDVASKMNTGAKYDNKVFKKSVGLNGVGIKAVNALSSSFTITAVREGVAKEVTFSKGRKTGEIDLKDVQEENGTKVSFVPDEEVFKKYRYLNDYIENMMKNYTFLNAGLTIEFNGERFYSRNGLRDLLEENLNHQAVYPVCKRAAHHAGRNAFAGLSRGAGENYPRFLQKRF